MSASILTASAPGKVNYEKAKPELGTWGQDPEDNSFAEEGRVLQNESMVELAKEG